MGTKSEENGFRGVLIELPRSIFRPVGNGGQACGYNQGITIARSAALVQAAHPEMNSPTRSEEKTGTNGIRWLSISNSELASFRNRGNCGDRWPDHPGGLVGCRCLSRRAQCARTYLRTDSGIRWSRQMSRKSLTAISGRKASTRASGVSGLRMSARRRW